MIYPKRWKIKGVGHVSSDKRLLPQLIYFNSCFRKLERRYNVLQKKLEASQEKEFIATEALNQVLTVVCSFQLLPPSSFFSMIN